LSVVDGYLSAADWRLWLSHCEEAERAFAPFLEAAARFPPECYTGAGGSAEENANGQDDFREPASPRFVCVDRISTSRSAAR
jgi:hypothetical protein